MNANPYIWDSSMDGKAIKNGHTVAVSTCGRSSAVESGDFMTLRKNGYDGWSLFYCESGRVEFGDVVLNPGEAWIYEPGVEQRYMMYRKDNTVYHYLHFNGDDIGNMFSSLGIPMRTPIKVSEKGILGVFEQLAEMHMNDTPYARLCEEYLALLLFTYVAKRNAKRSDRKMMKIIIDRMEHSFAKRYDPEDYAKLLYISVDRFQHLFKEIVGVAPYAYYIMLRMDHAARLLVETDMRIRDIAESCGYKDSLYFSQAFKKERGITPSAYRKKYKSNLRR